MHRRIITGMAEVNFKFTSHLHSGASAAEHGRAGVIATLRIVVAVQIAFRPNHVGFATDLVTLICHPTIAAHVAEEQMSQDREVVSLGLRVAALSIRSDPRSCQARAAATTHAQLGV